MEDAVLGMPVKVKKTKSMIKIQFRLASLGPLEMELLIERKVFVVHFCVFNFVPWISKWFKLPDTNLARTISLRWCRYKQSSAVFPPPAPC